MLISNKFLKFFYTTLLSGMPSLSVNPINKNILHAPFIVNPSSTYINYKLDENQYKKIDNFLKKNDNNFNMLNTSIIKDTNKDYFLSINIYNCTSPIFNFLTKEPVTRCEINTYVINKDNLIGTLIMDYVSNILSLDPDNLFKRKNDIYFKKNNNIIYGNAKNDNFYLDFSYDVYNNINKYKLSLELIEFTDVIFYNCGLYDKLYYDSSLINNDIVVCNNNNIKFNFLDLEFTNVDSVFYFEKKIDFIGGMWANIFKHNV